MGTTVRQPDIVPTLEGEQRNNKKHIDPSFKKLIYWISFPMIFQLFLLLRLFFLFFPPFPSQARLGKSKAEILWWNPPCHSDRFLEGPGRGNHKPDPRMRQSFQHYDGFSVSRSWQIVKIIQQEDWLWFFKVAYNYNARYLRVVFYFKLFQHKHMMSPNSIILAIFTTLLLLFFNEIVKWPNWTPFWRKPFY